MSLDLTGIFGGVPKRMVYDNLKTVLDAIFVGIPTGHKRSATLTGDF